MATNRKEQREPFARTFCEWDTTAVASARLLADGGNLRAMADLVDELRADDRIGGVLQQLSLALLGLPLTFEASGDGRKRNKVVRAVESDDDWWDMTSEADLADLFEWGLVAGVGLAELVYPPNANDFGRVVPRLKVWHPRWLRWDWQKRSWWLWTDESAEIEITPGDGKWLMFTPFGRHRPWARGLWRRLAKRWLLKTFAITDWARHSEMHGLPLRVGTTPESSTPEQREAYADELDELGRDTSIVLPPGYALEFKEAVARTWEMFPKQIESADLAIAIAVLGQNLTTEVQGGSLAASEVHRVVKAELLRFYAEGFATCLHDQLLEPWAEINFGTRALAPWPNWALPKPAPAPAPTNSNGTAPAAPNGATTDGNTGT